MKCYVSLGITHSNKVQPELMQEKANEMNLDQGRIYIGAEGGHCPPPPKLKKKKKN